MDALVGSIERVEARVKEYNKQVKDMAAVMPYTRAWYAVQKEDEWLFGPSKFVGYDDLTAKEYLARARKGLDGRVTEGVLQRWSDLVEKGHPKYRDLHTALSEFCARFGKKPNSLARISILKTNDEAASEPMFDDHLVPLLVAVYHQLTPAQKSTFRKQAT